MEYDVSQQPAVFEKIWVWAQTHGKQLLVGVAAVIVLGLAVAFYIVHLNQVQIDANTALSQLATRSMNPNNPAPSADALLKIGSDYSGTDGGQRALILAASTLYADGKYDDARAQFQRFLQQYPDSPFAGEAQFGVAACLDAQGRTQEAIDTYRAVADHYAQNWNVGPRAMLSLARLLMGQGKLEDARGELMDVARNFQGAPISSEAQVRLRQLFLAHPELIPQQPAQARQGPPMLENPVRPPASAPSAPPTMMNSTNRPGALPPFVFKTPPTNQSGAPAPFVIKVPPTNKP